MTEEPRGPNTKIIEEFATRSMSMDERRWARHASKRSVWTRILSFPFLLLALWSIHWIGWWSVLPIGAFALWSWLNPGLFPPPTNTDNWGSKVTFGERLWLNRRTSPIAAHHERAAGWLVLFAALGVLIMLAGLAFKLPAVFIGGAFTAFWLKMWFCDRMVWLFEDTAAEHAAIGRWVTKPETKDD